MILCLRVLKQCTLHVCVLSYIKTAIGTAMELLYAWKHEGSLTMPS
jgi:hypothetical protein